MLHHLALQSIGKLSLFTVCQSSGSDSEVCSAFSLLLRISENDNIENYQDGHGEMWWIESCVQTLVSVRQCMPTAKEQSIPI